MARYGCPTKADPLRISITTVSGFPGAQGPEALKERSWETATNVKKRLEGRRLSQDVAGDANEGTRHKKLLNSVRTDAWIV